MLSVLCRAWGGPELLTVAETPSQPTGAGQVRIRVRAAGVNFADGLMLTGNYVIRPSLPFIPGMEAAGEITETGPDVTGLSVGDRVLTLARRGGCYTQEMIADARLTVRIPDAMDFPTASTFAIAYGTARFALLERGNLKAGETLLVLGASGGVGLAAIEVGKALGAKVIAVTSSPEKLRVCTDHGADALIDRTGANLRERVKAMTDGKGVDVVFDPVGGSMTDDALRTTAWGGRHVIVGFASGDLPKVAVNYALVKNRSILGAPWGNRMEIEPDATSREIAQLLGWWSEGRLKPRLAAVLPMAQAAEALRMLAARETVGKIALNTGGA